ncbi:hypothetical protein [Spirosoma koreense]
MAYINLQQIGELASETLSLQLMAESYCFGTDSEKKEIDDSTFVALIKTHKQAENLFNKLRQLHQVCTDFVNGNLQPYIDKHEQWKEDDDDVFEPWDELDRCFNTYSIHDLPERIEQYAELMTFVQSFAELQKRQREGFAKFLGKMPRYFTATDEAGQTVMIPESEMPADFLHQRAVSEEIAEVEMEYCLDRYNDFYFTASAIYGSRAGASDDVASCAELILGLFAPYQTKR